MAMVKCVVEEVKPPAVVNDGGVATLCVFEKATALAGAGGEGAKRKKLLSGGEVGGMELLLEYQIAVKGVVMSGDVECGILTLHT